MSKSKEHQVENMFKKNIVQQDRESKVWKSIVEPRQVFTYQSLSEVLLNSLKSHPAQTILEYHYDLDKERIATDIYYDSITFARYLHGLGIRKGDVIVVFSTDHFWISTLTTGCCLIGAVVNFFEVNLENEYIDYTFDLLRPTVILYEAKWLNKIEKSLERKYPSSLKQQICIEDGKFLEIFANRREDSDLENFQCAKIVEPQQEVALLVLTSGSSGKPKVVQISHALFLHSLTIWWYSSSGYEIVDSNSVLLSFSPLRWMSQISIMFQSLIFGAKRICILKKLEGREFGRILQNKQITHLFATPTFFYSLLLEMDITKMEDCWASVKFIQVSGETPFLALMQLVKKVVPRARTFYCFGMSELSGVMCNDADINGGYISPGFQIQLLDEAMNPLDSINKTGHLAMLGYYPLLGYKGIDNTTYFTANGFFLSGDYAFMDENQKLHILGRYKDLIKAPHKMIIPSDIEGVVNELPEVFTSVLSGYRLPNTTAPYERAALFVVLRNSIRGKTKESIGRRIYMHLKQKLNEEDLSIIEDIYIKDELPLNCCGKTHRQMLKEEALERKQAS